MKTKSRRRAIRSILGFTFERSHCHSSLHRALKLSKCSVTLQRIASMERKFSERPLKARSTFAGKGKLQHTGCVRARATCRWHSGVSPSGTNCGAARPPGCSPVAILVAITSAERCLLGVNPEARNASTTESPVENRDPARCAVVLHTSDTRSCAQHATIARQKAGQYSHATSVHARPSGAVP
jgi:hypothetical protein